MNRSFAYKTANQTGVTSGTDITFESSTGNVAFASNEWTLEAGKTYWLEAMLAQGTTNAESAMYAWVDSTNTVLTGTTRGNTKAPTGANNGSAQSNAAGYYTPAVNTVVHIRVTNVSASMTIAGGSVTSAAGNSWARVQQVD